jgi:flagellar motility protein MotE (MotC chaperone)
MTQAAGSTASQHRGAIKANVFHSTRHSPPVHAGVQGHRHVRALKELHAGQSNGSARYAAEFDEVLEKLREHAVMYQESREADFRKVVKIFENMRPRKAAPIIEKLPDDLRIMILTAMKERTAASILAYMTPKKAMKTTRIIISTPPPPDILLQPPADSAEARQRASSREEHTVKQRS